LDHKRNELIKEELKTTPTAEYLQQYKKTGCSTKSNGIFQTPSQKLLYIHRGRRSRGRPPKSWQEIVTGH
jgi:hypothetical protein